MAEKTIIQHFENNEIKTLVELVRWRAQTEPDKRAYTYLKDGKKPITMTYNELDARARALAASLQQKGLSGHRALLLYPPGLEYIVGFFGCLYANVIAVPAYPPDPNRLNRSLPRLQAIVNDSKSTISLTTDSIMAMIRMLRLGNKIGNTLGRMPFLRKFRTTMRFFSGSKSGVAESHSLGDLEWISSDKIPHSLANEWRDPQVNEDTIAFLQYTSGSTGDPKGVILTHYNLLANSKVIYDTMQYPENGEGVFWIPIYHDMGLIGGVLQPLYGGVPSTLMSPITFLQHPLRWLEAINNISKDKIVATAAPNFAYELCIKKATPEKIAHLDLSNWEIALSGAEPVRASTIDRFSEVFGKVGFKKKTFFPAYGLAEATLLVTGSLTQEGPVYLHVDKFALKRNKILEVPAKDENSQTLVSSGYSHPLQKVAIVNPDSFEECRPGEIGEIWVKGPSVSSGYYEREQETKETFHNYIKGTNDGPYLRTGDLGFLKDNRLYVTGRVKDLIIIRGTNHYPQDIEATVESAHPLIRAGCSAAFTVEESGQEELVVVAEVRQSKNANFSEAIDAIRQAVVENHDLQAVAVVLIKARTINKTSSGKIQRRATKEDFLNNDLQLVAEWRAQAPLQTAPAEVSKEEGKEIEESLKTAVSKDEKTRVIEQWLIKHLAENLSMSEDQIDIRAPFISFGLDSAQAVGLAGDLEDFLGRTLSPTLIWDYPTIEELAHYLAQEDISTAMAMVKTRPKVQPEEPIAVIGMGAKFPKAFDLQAFWELLKNNVDGISEVPSDRWDADKFYSPQHEPGKMITKSAGFVENVDLFDAHFFGISPREAVQIDPQQRLLLEVTWQAFEHAGLPVNKVMGSKTGVFVGISSNDYIRLQHGHLDKINPYSGTGNAFSIAANRISYLFDLQGPSLAIDTACSSSLVAVHEAAQSLLNGDCDMAVAGGVNLILSPELSITFSQAHMLSPDGRCKTFDASADGYGRGEGAGVVILKRLSDAINDGDRILAVIRGSAVNQDGKSNGITAPSGMAQQNVILAALSNAEVEPEQIQYVEAHGTGTSLGDPIEIESIKKVLLQNRSPENPLYVGSVKTNIGHLESAAGIAGFIKTVLALHHQQIPAHLHFKEFNPHIKLNGAPLQIPTQNVPWKKDARHKRLAGVSAFGFGGTNAHVILEEAPEINPPDPERGQIINEKPFILPLTAKTENALKDFSRSMSRFVQTKLNNDLNSLYDLLYTAALKRSHLDQRLAIIAENKEELQQNLQDFTEQKENGNLISGTFNPNLHFKIAYVFSGQGPQWWAMGRELYKTEPVFKATIDRISLLLSEYVDWSLTEELLADEAHSRLDETEIAQPALFAIQVALVALWRSWGILPDAVVGHSVGEVAAAHVAGILSLDTAVKVIFHRSRLMQKATGQGKMAAIDLPLEEVQKLIAPYADRLSIGAHNSVTSTVISGDEQAIDAVLADLEGKDVFFKKLPVNYAFHSPVMDAYLEELKDSLQSIQVHQMQILIVSTVSGHFAEETDYNADYWAQNVRQFVHFSQAVDQLIDKGYNIFIEIGPHPVLKNYLKQNLTTKKKEAFILPSLHRKEPERRRMLSTLATLYSMGYPVDWSRLYNKEGQLIDLPLYPFQRQHYWITDELKTEPREVLTSVEKRETHPLLGTETRSPFFPTRTNWSIKLDSNYLRSFMASVNLENSFLPETAYLEMAAAASEQIFGQRQVALNDLVFKNLFTLSDNQNRELQFSLIPVSPKKAYFQAYSRIRGNSWHEWKLHSLGTINSELASNFDTPISITEMLQQGQPLSEDTISSLPPRFETLKKSLQALWQNDNWLLAKLDLAQLRASDNNPYLIDPLIINTAFQLMAVKLAGTNQPLPPFTLKSIKSLKLFRRPEDEFWVYLKDVSTNGEVSIEMSLLDNNEKLLMQIDDLRFKPIPLHEALANISYTLGWNKLDKSYMEAKPRLLASRWIIFGDQSSITEQLVAYLNTKGFEYFTVILGNDNKILDEQTIVLNENQIDQAGPLLEKLLNANTEAVYLWSINSEVQNEKILRSLSEVFTQQLNNFWLITQNAFPVHELSEKCDPEQTLLSDLFFGYGKQKPNLKQVDLDVFDTRQLFKVFQLPVADQRLVIRQKNIYVERLKRQMPLQFRAPISSEIKLQAKRYEPDENEIEVEIKALGLNTRDLQLAGENQLSELNKIGLEFSGVVTRIGNKVEHLKVGQPVMGLIHNGLRQYALVNSHWVIPIPEGLNFQQAAALPFHYFTAHYALNYLAQIQPDDKVLIHNADSPMGQALIHVANAQHCTVFATVKELKNRNSLKTLKVKHVFLSEDLNFIDEILQITGDEGVDIIVNTCSNEKVINSFALLKDFGRFIELNPRDSFGQSIVYHHLRYNVSFFAVDLENLARQQPQLIKRFSEEVQQKIAKNIYQPLPVRTFAVNQIGLALHKMGKSAPDEKFVLSLEQKEATKPTVPSVFMSEARYLVVGSATVNTLGLLQFMLKQGVQSIDFVPLNDSDKFALPNGIRRVNVLDDRSFSVEGIQGVIINLGQIDSQHLIEQLTTIEAVFLKTRELPLDFFISVSRFALEDELQNKTPNFSMDHYLLALHKKRMAAGLPSLHVQLGGPLPTDHSVALGRWSILNELITIEKGHLIITETNWANLFSQKAPEQIPPLLLDLLEINNQAVGKSPQFKPLTRAEVLALNPEDRFDVIRDYLSQVLAKVIKVPAKQINHEIPLTQFGIDSLMAIELKNTVEKQLEVSVPIATLLQGPSVNDLTNLALDQIESPDQQSEKISFAQRAIKAEETIEFRLSHGQQAMYFQHTMNPQSVFNLAYAVRIRSEVDTEFMRDAFQKLVDRHPALRTTFHLKNGEPIQRIHPTMPVFFDEEDVQALNEEQIRHRLQEEVESHFDLENGPLMRIYLFKRGSADYILLFVMHHIVTDIWSQAVLLDELSQIFENDGDDSVLEPLAADYTDFIEWQDALLSSEEGHKLFTFWANKLSGELPVLNLPTDRPRPAVQTFKGSTETQWLPETLSNGVHAFCEKHGLTPFAFLLSAYYLLLHRYSGQNDLIVGSPTAGRSLNEFNRTIGYFVNPLPVRVQIDPYQNVGQFLNQVKQTVLEVFEHMDYPLTLLVEKLQPKRDPSRTPLFQTMFVLERAHLMHDQGLSQFALSREGAQLKLGNLTIESMSLEQGVAPFDLTMMAVESGKGLAVSLGYNVDLFDQDTIQRMLQHYLYLIEQMVKNPEEQIARLSLITESEFLSVQKFLQGKTVEKPAFNTIIELFEQRVEQFPQKEALLLGDQALTYQELNARANQLAHYLLAQNIQKEERVGICLDRSFEMVVTMLAVLKAGAAYVPIDPDYPLDRIHYMLNDADMKIVLTKSSFAGKLNSSKNLVFIDTLNELKDYSIKNPAIPIEAHNLAYLIYTSGSTGKPKGTMLQHGGLVNTLLATAKRYWSDEHTRQLQFASFSFDASVEEIFRPLILGGTVVLIKAEDVLSLNGLTTVINKHQVTHITLPPSVLAILNPEQFPTLKVVVSAGEKCTPEIARKWKKSVQHFVNGYGPTEATICTTTFEVPDDFSEYVVPIGTPIENMRTYILDAHLNPLPMGIPGELYIAGLGLARGYLNRPDLTAERFVPDPYSETPGDRMYRTGDLVRLLKNGQLEFLDRVDEQIKIRGYRVELGEIENVIESSSMVKDAVVIAKKIGSDVRIVAYLIPDENYDENKLRTFLKQQIPDFMIPAHFIEMEKFPLTANGKVDKHALPDPEATSEKRQIIKPQTNLERKLVNIWKEVLQIDEISIYDSFFDLGGHSLGVIQIQGKLKDELDIVLDVVDIFKYPTIHGLAQYLENQGAKSEELARSMERASRQREATSRMQQLRMRQQKRKK
ncbi:MAG: amino acid adenylation domain-containing protein [Caldisericaceae bacterium]|nr:amino acid adenylation domain-containing protein [Caldisericaceae bacterium]